MTDTLDLLGAVVTLMAPQGGTSLVACSGDEVRRVEETQFALGEGPSGEAYRTGRPVLVYDLAPVFARWPGFVSAASRAGVGAAYVVPIQVGAARFGVLACYAEAARSLDAGEVAVLLSTAEQAFAILLGPSSPGADAPGDHDRLRGALSLRNEIYQAQGMVKVQLGVSLAEALTRMRAHAFAEQVELADLAIGILDGTIRLPDD